jgi:hypothetical protein
MRIWTMLLSLVVMAALAVDVSAAGKSGKGGGTRPAPLTWEQLLGGKTGPLTCEMFVDARVKAAPADADKDQTKTRAEGMWKRLVDTKCGETKGDVTTFTEQQYKDAMTKTMESFKGKGGKKKGA